MFKIWWITEHCKAVADPEFPHKKECGLEGLTFVCWNERIWTVRGHVQDMPLYIGQCKQLTLWCILKFVFFTMENSYSPFDCNCKNFNNLMLAFYTINLPQKCEVGFSVLMWGDVHALGCYITKCTGDSIIKVWVIVLLAAILKFWKLINILDV